MKTIKMNVYTIDELKELNKTAFNNVIDHEKQYLIEASFNNCDYDIKDMLKNDYGIDEKILDDYFYSISYCQGDGFCFTASNLLSYTRLSKKENMNSFEKWIIGNLSGIKLMDVMEYLNCNYNLKIIKKSHMYSHAHTCALDYEYFYSSDNPEVLDRINNTIDELCNNLYENVYLDICYALESYLYTFYDIDDDEVIESIKNNDFLFFSDGSLYQ